MPTVAFATLGCRVNQVDTEEMQAALEADDFRTVPFGEPADVVVVNSCTVTARAEFSDRQMVRRAARTSADARVVVTGCWAQVDARAAAMPGVDLVVGTGDRARLPALLHELLAEPRSAPRIHVGDLGTRAPLPAPSVVRSSVRSRAFVKAQDGCQHRCAFCIVPLARGASRSVEPDALVAQVEAMAEAGHAEVVLTGVDLGHYGADLTPRTTLAALIRALIAIPSLRRLRLSSVLPAYLSDELIDVLVHAPVIAPHLHVPLQSGSDRILRRMRRPYTVAMYRRVVERLAAGIPRLGLGADVIVGFPGETDADFEATVAIVQALPFTYLHVFPYSARTGTEATRVDGHVDERIIGQRSRRLRDLARDKATTFRRSGIGDVEHVVLLEGSQEARGRLVGLTGNYVEVVFAGTAREVGGMARVRVTGVEGERMTGELV